MEPEKLVLTHPEKNPPRRCTECDCEAAPPDEPCFCWCHVPEERRPVAPLPLSAPDGQILAWACGVCRSVTGGGTSLAPDPADRIKMETEVSHREATRCCTCPRCGGRWETAPLEQNNGVCDSCWELGVKIEVAQRNKRLDEEAAERARLHKESLGLAEDRAAAGSLLRRMSDLSEETTCASWLDGTALAVWWAVQREWGGSTPTLWGEEVSADDLDRIRELSERARGWWVHRRDAGFIFVPMHEWYGVVSKVPPGTTLMPHGRRNDG